MSKPLSSLASRVAAFSGVSPISIPPPGMTQTGTSRLFTRRIFFLDFSNTNTDAPFISLNVRQSAIAMKRSETGTINLMRKFVTKNYPLVLAGVVLLSIVGVFFFLKFNRPENDKFEAPGENWDSPKKVEDYFVERLRMGPQEAAEIRTRPGADGKVDLRINKNVTLVGLVGNLYYYGLVRYKDSFLFALEHTKDTTPSDQAIGVGKNGTIDTNAEYRISENMSAWEIADVLLNKPSGHFPFDEYNYFFMP